MAGLRRALSTTVLTQSRYPDGSRNEASWETRAHLQILQPDASNQISSCDTHFSVKNLQPKGKAEAVLLDVESTWN